MVAIVLLLSGWPLVRIPDPVAAADAFVAEYWRKRGQQFKKDVETRIEFADQHFSLPEVLRQARAATARAVVAATGDELANVEIALLARELNPRQRVVVRLSDAQLAETLREGANIRYALKAAHIASDRHDARLFELMSLVGLDGMASRPARKLSGGEQQRLALARALARDPEVLFLDEPTASLDPAATKAIEDVVRTVAARGIKIVMSTHDLAEARRLAGEIVLIHRGRVVEHGLAAPFFERPNTEEARRFIAGDLLV